MRSPLFATAILAVSLAGCDTYGPSCQNACTRLFGTSGDCQIDRPGVDPTRAYADCMTRCEDALKKPGELDGYDPNRRTTGGETVEIVNEKQAAVWMDCVMENSCKAIEDGYCRPI